MPKSLLAQLLTTMLPALSAPLSLLAAECPEAARLTAGLREPLATVRYLSDDALAGRLAGTEGERCAAEFIARRFQALGLRPAGANNSYFQIFPLASAVNPHAPAGEGRNVIALLPGGDPQLQQEVIVVGAHYDHLGYGEFGSRATGERAIHNGADDNASGVAVLLEVAARLASGPRPQRSVLFIAFSGEESGLLGSMYFVKNATSSITHARAMLNLDMVGRLGAGPLIVHGIGTAREWEDVVNKAATAEQLAVKLIPDGYGPSDHTSFYMKDVPVLHFFTNVHTDYHMPTDDWDKIDTAGLQKVVALVRRIAQHAANGDNTLTLVRGAGRPPGPGQARGYGAYLGTVPDYSPAPHGVRLSGVSANSPAQKAGLQAGDIIVRFDDEEISDLQAMTDALRKRKPGERVHITVVRDGSKVVVDAVLGRR